MVVVTGVELECSYGAGDGQTRSGVASMPKERSGRPRLDWSCDWEKYGYDTYAQSMQQTTLPLLTSPWFVMHYLQSPVAISISMHTLQHSGKILLHMLMMWCALCVHSAS